MNILQSQSDLTGLDSKVFPEPLCHFASNILQSLTGEVGRQELEEHLLCNPVILCGPEDRIITLLETNPLGYEYIERHKLDDATIFRVGVMLDNDWFAQYLISADVIDADTYLWLDERVVMEVLFDE